MDFSGRDGCRHPIQLYAASGRFALLGFLFFIKRKLKDFKSGFLFWIFVFLIGHDVSSVVVRAGIDRARVRESAGFRRP